jgi:hypothetical protein
MLRVYSQQQNANDLRESRLKLTERTERLSDMIRHSEIRLTLYHSLNYLYGAIGEEPAYMLVGHS